MNPTRVLAENYRTYERLDVPLPQGCTAIIGPNGAGKSSIVNLVELALFGPANRQMAPLLTEGSADELVIGLEFEHRGESYRIRRRYSPAGRGKTTLDLEQASDIEVDGIGLVANGLWHPLTRTSMSETQAVIDELVGLSRDTFRASAFLAQGDGAAFTEALPSRRKEILGEVLGLGLWDALNERAKSRLSAVERSLVGVAQAREVAQEVALGGHDLDVALRVDRATLIETNEKIEVTEGELEAAREAYGMARVALARTDGAKATLRAAEEKLAALQELDQRSSAAAAALASHEEPLRAAREAAGPLEGLLAALEAEKERVDGHRLLVAERRNALTQVELAEHHLGETRKFRDKVIARLEDLESGEVAFCETCGQVLQQAERAKVSADLREELAHYDEKIPLGEERLAEAQAKVPADPGEPPTLDALNDLTMRIGAARLADRDVAILQEKVRHLESQAGDGPKPELLVEAHQAVIDAGAEVQRLAAQTKGIDLDELKEAGTMLTNVLREQTRTREALTAAIARNESRLEAVQAAEANVKRYDSELAELRAKKQVLDLAVRAYSRDGVPALIVESVAVPQIEAEANRILEALQTPYMVELRTQKEAKSSGTISESLDIIIHTAGGERPYETFSGGERTRLNLSLRIALARLLAHRRGAEVQLLAIDEPEFLDDDGVEQLAVVLNGLASDFERIILISHMPALRESFPQALVVVKDGDRSHVMGQDDGLGVAA